MTGLRNYLKVYGCNRIHDCYDQSLDLKLDKTQYTIVCNLPLIFFELVPFFIFRAIGRQKTKQPLNRSFSARSFRKRGRAISAPPIRRHRFGAGHLGARYSRRRNVQRRNGGAETYRTPKDSRSPAMKS